MTESANIGPSNGSLVIVGGGGKIAGILKRFVALAGGPGASIVIIPTADEEDHFGPSAPSLEKLAPQQNLWVTGGSGKSPSV